MKLNNLGTSAKPLYEEFIESMQNEGFEFITIKEYSKIKGFLK